MRILGTELGSLGLVVRDFPTVPSQRLPSVFKSIIRENMSLSGYEIILHKSSVLTMGNKLANQTVKNECEGKRNLPSFIPHKPCLLAAGVVEDVRRANWNRPVFPNSVSFWVSIGRNSLILQNKVIEINMQTILLHKCIQEDEQFKNNTTCAT